MKKIYTFSIIFTLFCCTCIGQSKFQAGVQLGATNYFGDLAPDNPINYVKQTNIVGGVLLRYHLNDYFNFRTGFNYGWIEGSDANGANASRNFEFRTNIAEVDLLAEFNFIGFQPAQLRRPLSPYAFAGITLLRFNPQRFHRGDWVDLQPLGTEGQGTSTHPGFDPYNLNDIVFKFGVGSKFALSEALTLHVEIDLRKTYTDYIDDVSGNYANNFSALINENGPIAAELSWPAALLNDMDLNNFNYPAGATRGNISQEDWYASVNVGLSFNFLAKKYRRNKNFFRNLTRCFKFKK